MMSLERKKGHVARESEQEKEQRFMSKLNHVRTISDMIARERRVANIRALWTSVRKDILETTLTSPLSRLSKQEQVKNPPASLMVGIASTETSQIHVESNSDGFGFWDRISQHVNLWDIGTDVFLQVLPQIFKYLVTSSGICSFFREASVDKSSYIANAMPRICSSLIYAAILHPFDLSVNVISGRKGVHENATCNQEQYNGVIDCAYKIGLNEGIPALYSGFMLTCANIVLSNTFFFTYFSLTIPNRRNKKRQQSLKDKNDDDKSVNSKSKNFLNYLFNSHISRSILPSFLNTLVLYPLSTIRRRMCFYRRSDLNEFQHFISTASDMMKTDGFSAFYSGFSFTLSKFVVILTTTLLVKRVSTLFSSNKKLKEVKSKSNPQH